MKYSKTKIVFFAFIGVFFLLLAFLFMFYLSVTDTENVKIEGYVYDKMTNKPIESAKILIENYRYEDNNGNSNYDEYLGLDKISVCTDKNGFYETKFDKSAYVVIEIHKNGYKTTMENGEYSSKNMDFKTDLEKNDYSINR
ncbi:hypothetical protein [Flavobacterium sp.]|uniref:hypothetical protein n=1 Tax=Flavobacterium sp. TaxID=239 RepID=UPI002634A2E7|nr:hypothetical protein [Flavobacterium sp.]